MTRKSFIALAWMSLLFASLACQFSGEQTVQPTQEPVSAAVEATPIVLPIATENSRAAALEAEETARAATATQDAFKATENAGQAALEFERTAAVKAEATAAAESMHQVVEKLRDENVIASSGGTYYRLKDFEKAWAQIGWWQWWSTGYQPSNFVVRAHTSWESASLTANWYDAGCGFVFRALDENNHYLIYLALDGNVYMKGIASGKHLELGREYYGPLSHMEGEADVMLVADKNKIIYYINGEKIFEREHDYLSRGDLAYTLVSGTNKDFGTRCTITNIELWDMTRP